MSEWKIDKNITTTFLLGLGIQAFAIVWSFSMMMSTINDHEEDIAQIQGRLIKLEEAVQLQAVTSARIDANIEAIKDTVEDISDNMGETK
tara:strand:+ start:353 stop:622 length:270 start_codon:yes stop_codon:yes gene_type:complete